jgi:ribosomal protein L31
MKIAICLIATNKYTDFFYRLEKEIFSHFLSTENVHIHLFTNKYISKKKISKNISIHKIIHEPWPLVTLKRFQYISSIEDSLLNYDYIFYMDVDMKINSPIGNEILGSIISTKHPGYVDSEKTEFPVCKDSNSTAYIKDTSQLKNYFAGGFFGGESKEFLKLSSTLEKNIQTDINNKCIPIWHDESHLNFYLSETRPTKILDEHYCFDENNLNESNHNKAKIIALSKDHSLYRYKYTKYKRAIYLPLKAVKKFLKKLFQ